MDVFTRKKRSWIMGRIRSKNTKPEIIVRSILHRLGCRFSLRRVKLPGSPDIVLPKYRTVVFVHGCFWHRHKGCKVASMPKTRVEFWEKKFDKNVARDRQNLCELRKLGWETIVVWECQAMSDPAKLAEKLFQRLGMPHGGACSSIKMEGRRRVRKNRICYHIPERPQLLKIAEKRADYNR